MPAQMASQVDFACQSEFKSPSLSIEQMQAVDSVIAKEIRILMGSAGTGKSTVIAEIARQLGDKCMIITPTDKTQIALEEKSVRNVQQVTGLLKNKKVQNKLFDKGVTHIIVDEAGMIDRRTKVLLEKYIANGPNHSIHLAFIGDPCQLDPISDHADRLGKIWFDNESPDFILTKGYRQDANVKLSVVRDANIDWKSTTICMTNATRNEVNLAAHISKHGCKAFTSRKRAILDIHPGDKLICYQTDSNQRYRNNCVYTVSKVEYGQVNELGRIADRGKDCFIVWFEGSRQSVIIEKSMFRAQESRKCQSEKRMGIFLCNHLPCRARIGP